MFTENELKMIQFALSRLHDADLSGLKKEDLEALESAMNKLFLLLILIIWKMGVSNIRHRQTME